MNKVFIDYNKLTSSANLLKTSAGAAKKVINEMESAYEDISNVGSKHDNCFRGLSISDITASLKSVDNQISKLSSSMLDIVMFFSFAESSDAASYKINSKGLSNIDIIKLYEDKLKNNDTLKEGFDSEHYNKLLNDRLSMYDINDTKSRVVATAAFLALEFPKINYFWGGGHEGISTGIDSNWGSPKLVTAGGSDTTGTYQPNSLDCSGYVSWSLKNGGYDLNRPMVVSELKTLGTCESITDAAQTVQVGDLAYKGDGHVGIIIAKNSNMITISHSSGSGQGMSITTVDTTTGKVVSDALNKERIGTDYFDGITHIDYGK